MEVAGENAGALPTAGAAALGGSSWLARFLLRSWAEESCMRAAATTARTPRLAPPPDDCLQVTLLDLVRAVSEECESEAEVVATVLHMLATGRARLCGSFRSASLRDLCKS
jgi:hypothetical protein